MISPTRLRIRILACALSILLFNTLALFRNLPRALAGDTDFRSLYAAGAILRTGHAASLYRYDLERTVQNTLVSSHPGALPFLYPAYAALPFVPLSTLPYPTAYLVFLLFNLLLLLAAAHLLRPCLPVLTGLFPPFPALLFLAFFPVAVALYQGQVSLLLLLLFCAAYTALERQKSFLAGLLLSLALIKFHVVLPIVLLFAIWRFGRLILGFAAGAFVLTILSIAIQGTTGLRLYAHTLLSATATGAIGAENPYTVFTSKMPNLHGFWFFLLGTSHWITPVVLLTSAAVLFWAATRPPSLPRALVAALLVSYHLHMHDLTLLLLPLALALDKVLAAYQANARQPNRLQTAASLLWMISPLNLYLVAIGANGLLAPAMLPFLLL